MQISIIIADDHTLIRAGLRKLLCDMPEFVIVAEASNGIECLDLIDKHRPKLVLMDIVLPQLNGLEATKTAADRYPGVGILILSMHADESYVRRALEAGARGYILMDAEPEELRLAIHTIAQGKVFLSSTISRQMVNAYVHGSESEANALATLTARQREVLRHLAEGMGTKEIARTLKIGRRTVETHRYRIMQCLDIHDTIGLAHFAYRTGIAKFPV